MLRSMASCGSVPALYLKSNRTAPSPRTVAAIFRATVSGDPTYSDLSAISRSYSARLVGGQPRSDPIRFRITWWWGQSSSAAPASVSARWPGEWTRTGSVAVWPS